MAVTERIKLGELLVRAGAIDRAQLTAALAKQELWGLPLGMTLIELKFLDEETLVRTLARQLKVPLAWMRGKRVKPAVIDLIPAELAREHRYIPLTVRDEPTGRVLFLGMQDPGDLDALDNVRFRIGWRVKPILVAPSELEEALERYYPTADTDPRDRMLDLDPPTGTQPSEPTEPAEPGESPATADLSDLPAMPDVAPTPDDTAMPDASTMPDPSESSESSSAPNPDAITAVSHPSEISVASEVQDAWDAAESWDVSEEWEVTAEPEFLILEDVVESLSSVPVAPADFAAQAGRVISETARQKLVELVMSLVEEGVIGRDELIEHLNGMSSDGSA